MKRYKVIDLKYNKHSEYSNFEWNLAFLIIFIFGIITGICLSV
jgi:hypothetical protein